MLILNCVYTSGFLVGSLSFRCQLLTCRFSQSIGVAVLCLEIELVGCFQQLHNVVFDSRGSCVVEQPSQHLHQNKNVLRWLFYFILC